MLFWKNPPFRRWGRRWHSAPRTKISTAEALRKSARSAGVADEPVLARAIRLASDKNAPSSSNPGNVDSSNFTAFQSVPIDKLLSVAHDSCVIFPSSSLGPPEKIISLIQARELAQADLAAARHNAEVEAAKAQASAMAEKDPQVPQEGLVAQTGEGNATLDTKDKPAKKRKKTISLNQTAFIKGRNLLEGPLALIEIVHELRSKKLGGVLLKIDFEKAYDRVNWEFLAEVLRCKGFEEAYIHRVLQLVSGGQTAISINGVIGPYFRNKRGVRQGDPLSPLLFNFIGEALSGILSAAGAAGHLQGVLWSGKVKPSDREGLRWVENKLRELYAAVRLGQPSQ
ncbi:hypothetical protein QYE76_049042 [Lolium multiflorum]|uniref:Reverse transcriptase domain-containing protein n=1 Tax=Lolium multiflorum TaxID=4521 RepID=A0AAD8SM75_LOLMU|nr:hypothetical protein QYE76_049042 [Lolium multiflorum]